MYKYPLAPRSTTLSHPSTHQRTQTSTSTKTSKTNTIAKMHLPTLTLLTTSLAALGSATRFHNQFGKPGWLQDNQGTQVYIKNNGVADVGGGWGFFWVDGNVCHQNSVAFGWPADYGGA
jgi:hypothetical protein